MIHPFRTPPRRPASFRPGEETEHRSVRSMGLRCSENTRNTLIYGHDVITFCYQIAAGSPLLVRTTPDTHEVTHLHATMCRYFSVRLTPSVNVPGVYEPGGQDPHDGWRGAGGRGSGLRECCLTG
jgi:hypothetical protein